MTESRIEKCIVDLIIVDTLPYSIVEVIGLKSSNIGDPLVDEAKSEKCSRTTMMPATSDKVVKHVTNLLQEVAWISFTTDRWMEQSNKITLIAELHGSFHSCSCAE